jgi:hypothetical protein
MWFVDVSALYRRPCALARSTQIIGSPGGREPFDASGNLVGPQGPSETRFVKLLCAGPAVFKAYCGQPCLIQHPNVLTHAADHGCSPEPGGGIP